MPPLPAQPDSLVGRQAMPFPQSMGGPMGGLADSSQFSNGNSKTPFAEIREKLSMFYVSAIVGDRAILRRSPVQPAGTIAGVPGNPMMGPPGMMGGAIAQAPKPPSGQSETMTVTDGEPIDFIGDGITLIPRVTSSRVSIYYADDVARAKKGARRKVVFLGQVESIVTSPPAPIVLEKPDPTYKQRVSVETKSRSINNNQAQGQNPPNNLPQPLSN